MTALTHTHLPKLKLIAQGKVRDIYALPDEADSDKLLFVATDRISAFDVILDNVRTARGWTTDLRAWNVYVGIGGVVELTKQFWVLRASQTKVPS